MRTSFFYKTLVAYLLFFSASGTGVFSQTLGPGKYIGHSNYSNPIAILELGVDGGFSLSFSTIEHGGVRGTGGWRMEVDSLHLRFDEASLRPPDLSQITQSSWRILDSQPSDTPQISFVVVDSEQLNSLPGAKITMGVSELDYNVRTDIDGKSTLPLASTSFPDTIRVGFAGYLDVDIPTAGLEGEWTEIKVILAPSIYEGPIEPFSSSETWTFGLSLLENGDMYLANRDSSRTIRIWKK